MESRGPAQCHDQGARDARRYRCHPSADQRGHQRQRDLAVLTGCLRAGGRGLSGWPRGSRCERRDSRRRCQCGELVHQPDRRGRGCAHQEAGPRASPARQSRDRQRQAHVSAVCRTVRRPAVECSRAPGCSDTTGVVGEHGNQGSRLPGCALRRGTDRFRHREHHAASHGADGRTWTTVSTCGRASASKS